MWMYIFTPIIQPNVRVPELFFARTIKLDNMNKYFGELQPEHSVNYTQIVIASPDCASTLRQRSIKCGSGYTVRHPRNQG